MNVGQVAQALEAVAGANAVLTAYADRAPFLAEWRGNYAGAAPIVVQPGSVESVSAVVRCCAELGVPVVPQGGNTGLVGGSVSGPAEVVVSLSRLRAVREVDAVNFSLLADAGCTLAAAQAAADEVGLMLPLSLSSEGSCQIGGNLATNAGGVNVLRYGNARDQVLGLEVVLPDGTLLSALQALRKNNAGYDLKHLFVGSEGTLGIITGATLKLVPAPEARLVLWLALDSHAQVLEAYARFRRQFGATMAAFELIPDIAVDFVTRHIEGTRRPADAPVHALIELHGGRAEVNRDAVFASVTDAVDSGALRDAVVAESDRDQAALWAVRHHISEAQSHEGASIKHDIAVPLGALQTLIDTATTQVEALVPGVRPVCFGHIGDGNLHFNLSQPQGLDRAAFLAHAPALTRTVHEAAQSLGGTISAEHGIGLLKRDLLAAQVGPASHALMRRLKQSLDPDGIMNPGKLL
ncbi:MAG: FAD-binding oxidoreductase [Pseudomonadota bacterium]